MDTLFKKLGGMLSLALLAGLAQAETIEVTSDWMLFPVKNGGAKLKLLVKDGAESLPPKDIQLCSAAEADWWVPWNVRHLRGRKLEFTLEGCPPERKTLLEAIRLADAPPPGKSLADDPLRPQFHYSQRYGLKLHTHPSAPPPLLSLVWEATTLYTITLYKNNLTHCLL